MVGTFFRKFDMLPVLYLSHGSPMLAADPGPVGKTLAALGQEMAALGPRAIVVVSPHWMTRRPEIGRAHV